MSRFKISYLVVSFVNCNKFDPKDERQRNKVINQIAAATLDMGSHPHSETATLSEQTSTQSNTQKRSGLQELHV